MRPRTSSGAKPNAAPTIDASISRAPSLNSTAERPEVSGRRRAFIGAAISMLAASAGGIACKNEIRIRVAEIKSRSNRAGVKYCCGAIFIPVYSLEKPFVDLIDRRKYLDQLRKCGHDSEPARMSTDGGWQ